MVLVDIGGGSSHVLEMGSDPHAPGISELVSGAASFAEIITRDRYSRAHIITAGAAAGDGSAILRFPRLPVTLEALARSYDQVVMNAGALPEIPVERLAQFARWAVLVADAPDDPVTASMRERLCAAGFANVSVLASAPRGPQSDARRTRAAA